MVLVDYVNVLQGTDSTPEFSTGNTLPLTARPFGMTHWSPQTVDADRWWFSPRSRVFYGLRATHQPSPWIGDYGQFAIMPQTGNVMPDRRGRYSSFRPENMVCAPDRFFIFLERYQTHLEMIPTERCSWVRCKFPTTDAKRIIIDLFSGNSSAALSDDGKLLTGYTKVKSGGTPENFALYFAMRFDVKVTHCQVMDDCACCELPEKTICLNLLIGTSFIGCDQALINLEREIGTRSFDAVGLETRSGWERMLSAIIISGSERTLRTFYSCMYRTFLFPRELHEFDNNGNMIHYSPYDGRIHSGPMYGDNGFWDTHRTVYPLFSIILPRRYEEMLQGWTNAAAEGGWFPRWSSPGYWACMIGTHADAVVADAVVKGLTGFDVEAAYRAMLRNAYEAGDTVGRYGRMGIGEYMTSGYVPDDLYEHAASRTMDYAYNDFAIAQVAKYLGDDLNYRKLMLRSQNYRNIFNPVTGWPQGRRSDGSWTLPFSEFAWGGSYVEGSAWQCGWAIPHDIDGMIELFGGRGKFLERLEKLMTLPPKYETGAYGFEIHEMSEMAAVDFGQYAQSNQPSHHLPWLYAHAGAPEKAAYWVGRTVDELYSPDRFPGDEDNGEMSAWYIFATLGFYPICPGKPEYICVSPLSEEIILASDAGHKSCLHFRTQKYMPHCDIWRDS